MTQLPASATEEAGSIPVAPSGNSENTAKEEPRGFLRSGRKNLSEDDLSTAAARRFLIAEIERLDQQNNELKETEKKYNDLRVEYATLKENSKSSRWFEVLFAVGIGVGSAGLGAAPSYLAVDGVHGIGWTFVIGAALLLLASALARVFK